MNRLSIIFFFLTIFEFLSYSNQYSISYSWTESNGVRTYHYNGRNYKSENDVMKEIQKQHPGVIFGPISPGGGGSIGGYGRPGGPIGGYGRPGGSFGGHGRPTGSIGGWTGGFDISQYKGNNTFSNKIFDKVWEGYNYEKDSQQGFKDMKKRFLKESNKYRKAHKAPRLRNDRTLESKAQAYANYLANLGELVHDPNNGIDGTGENLYYGSPRISHLGVKKWYDEIDLYNFDKPGFSYKTGHFTQLVWIKTTKAGFGVAVGPKGVFVVCKYTPPGNYKNKYRENVLPRKK